MIDMEDSTEEVRERKIKRFIYATQVHLRLDNKVFNVYNIDIK